MNRKQVRFHRQLLCDEALEGGNAEVCIYTPEKMLTESQIAAIDRQRLIAFGKKDN